ncbi:non-homologous end-joining DNA ligase [Dactylosporangium sp. CA-139114]|uniref:ATP dependent DNA ligase n=1 Tax=Dactylosporangium sp. CA-139114 TaxID=3239931 RepID=UPI003D96B4AE
MHSRGGHDITNGFPEVREVVFALRGRRVVLDGELVAVDPATSLPSFARLQRRVHVGSPRPALLAAVPVRLVVFDVLHLDGHPTIQLPYHERRALLEQLGLDGDRVWVPPVFDDAVHALDMARRGFEGIVAKANDGRYLPGRRSPSWRKHVFVSSCDARVVGFRPGTGRRGGVIGALLLAAETSDGRLRYIGSVGSGLSNGELRHLVQLLGPLRRATPTVIDVPRAEAAAATWVEPVVTAEIAFKTTTDDGRLRHPVWRGVRTDLTVPGPRQHPAGRLPAPLEVIGAMSTPDGAWRIEVIRQAHRGWCRLVHCADVVDDLDMDQALQLLTVAGVDVATLSEIGTTAA